MKRAALLSALMLASSASLAAEGGSITLQTNNFYFGGGFGFNSHKGGRSTGFQILGGYEFAGKVAGAISTAVELGYMDTGTFEVKDLPDGSSRSINEDAEGIWLDVVWAYPISNRVEGLWRVGYDFGDDDGVMAGAGMGYNFNRNWALRSEYVVREAVNSFQFNVVYGF